MAKRRKQTPLDPARAAMDATRDDPPRPQTGTAESADAPSSRDSTAHPDRHGPQTPARPLYGLDHLRTVLKLSESVPLPDVCEEAALRLERSGIDRPPRANWRD
jgi:hypothetical protein